MKMSTMNRPRISTGRRGRPSNRMIAAVLDRPGSQFCAYLHRICLNNRLECSKYCIQHILDDRTAPYRLCTYIHPVSGKRCYNAAHKVVRKESPLCTQHQQQLQQQLAQSRATLVGGPNLSTAPPSQDDQIRKHLEDLSHYCSTTHPGNKLTSNTFWHHQPDKSAKASIKLRRLISDHVHSRDEDLALHQLSSMEEMAARHHDADSDTESVDHNHDIFKHAMVYTDEEVTRILREKLTKLRALYVEQYRHIQYLLKEKRLKFIQAQRNEIETMGSENCLLQNTNNVYDKKEYSKLRAMLRYHRHFGRHALLQEKAKELRQKKVSTPHVTKTSTTNPPTPTPSNTSLQAPTTNTPSATTSFFDASETLENHLQSNICIFSKNADSCTSRSLPLSPYCREHILYDRNQVLFRPCAAGNPPCLTPVMSYRRRNTCPLHASFYCETTVNGTQEVNDIKSEELAPLELNV